MTVCQFGAKRPTECYRAEKERAGLEERSGPQKRKKDAIHGATHKARHTSKRTTMSRAASGGKPLCVLPINNKFTKAAAQM